MPLPPMTPPLPAAAAAMASCMAGILSCLTICCTSMLSQEPRLPAARPPPPPGPPPPRPPPRPILPPREPPWDDFRRSIEFFRPVGEEEVRKCDVNLWDDWLLNENTTLRFYFRFFFCSLIRTQLSLNYFSHYHFQLFI